MVTVTTTAGVAGEDRAESDVEERPGSPGAFRALGGLGGHFGAPHVGQSWNWAARHLRAAPSPSFSRISSNFIPTSVRAAYSGASTSSPAWIALRKPAAS